MSGLSFFKSVKKVCGIAATVAVLATALASQVQAAPYKVTTHKDEQGWRIKVDGQDHYVKGMVWGYSPRNQNYTYNLWGESDDFIRKVLDYDFGLMAAAGVNTVRSFNIMPPEWVTYVYREHGIMTVINPLMGRYGATIGGRWVPNTDYSDPLTRETLKAESLAIVDRYKDVEGVLMFAFGNESNYGLSWSSFEIENLPVGEQNTAKARYLYSLWNEVMKEGKAISPDHLFSIVNGDIQYIDLIKEYCVDMDVLGSNVYRGMSFTSLWAEVDAKLDLPVVFYEFGSDAFNARAFKEDQRAQAEVLKEQWQEMYNKAWGNGEEGNAVGGFVFEWRDEWWKYLQVENLDIHDNNASWSNQAYMFDWAEGKNNMNEEWFGIAALGTPNADGVYEARPRMAYDVLKAIWSMDPYQSNNKSAVNQSIDNLDMDYYAMQGDVRLLKMEAEEKDKILRFTGGNLFTRAVLKGTERDVRIDGENGLEFSDGQMAFLDFGFTPNDKIDGQFTLNVLGNVADTEPLEIVYGRRAAPITIVGVQDAIDGVPVEGLGVQTNIPLTGRERVEIYDFEATYMGEDFDITSFYHVPRYHWKYEGDFFGLIREATDMGGQDIWNAKAPNGFEVAGKNAFDGLKILFGPEVYWGANPKVVLKYSSNLGRHEYTFMHSEDLARLGNAIAATAPTVVQSRQTTMYTETNFSDKVKLELGAMIASTERVDDPFTRVDGLVRDPMTGEVMDYRVINDEIDFDDTLAFRTRLTFPLFGSQAYFATNHAGLVAEGGDVLREFGTRMPYSSLGNTKEYEAGMMINIGNVMIFPRLLYRENYVDANPNVPASLTGGQLQPGISARNRDDNPFAVLDNREARAAEVFFTYDPTGATPFYAWDNDTREDAGFAFNLGLNYTEYPTFTDANLFFFEPISANASFGVGLPPEDVWMATSRMVFNPNRKVRFITNLHAGYQQSTGDPTGGTRRFFEAHGKVVIGGKHILNGYFKKDAFGPYDFHRQFNITFPEQGLLDYAILLDELRDELRSTRVGIRSLIRTSDENSPDDEFLDGDNDYIWQTTIYFRYFF